MQLPVRLSPRSTFASVAALVRDSSLGARLLRSSTWTMLGFAGSQAVRFGSNIILTRVLFPEAFGLMALVTVFMIGLAMFSDVGIGPSIQQSKRGDERDFLNTAWTIQLIRGACLWLLCCALAPSVAAFFGDGLLAQVLPIVGLTLFIGGFSPTRIETANRHLLVGRVALLELVGQVFGIVITVALAVTTRSVWSLVFGAVAGSVARQLVMHLYLPGERNRLRWDRTAVRELVGFGKWIFLGTICGFLLAQGDRAILGKYLSLESLGIYNIGFFLGSFPLQLGTAVTGRILIPLYRERPPRASAENFRQVRKVRFVITSSMMAASAMLAVCGVLVVSFLYDSRFAASGAVTVAVACLNLPFVVGMTYEPAALAAGDSRNAFFLLAAKAVLQITFFLVGIELYGLVGALAGQALAILMVHPLIALIARRHGAWDFLHDALFAVLALALAGAALWFNADAMAVLLEVPVQRN